MKAAYFLRQSEVLLSRSWTSQATPTSRFMHERPCILARAMTQRHDTHKALRARVSCDGYRDVIM